MTFYGESVAVDSFTNVTGSAVAAIEDVQVRAGSATFTAGDSTEFSSDLSYHYLEPGDPASVSWVVEVLSGSGTLTFAEGIGDTATSLGSRTVTGPAQVVVASTEIAAANVIADTDARLLLGCTSGTLVVQQVKLRVWPPDGVGGGWSDPYPSWSDEDPVPGSRTYRSVSGESFGHATAEDAWEAAIADAQTHTDEPWDLDTEFVTAPLRTGHAAETVKIIAAQALGDDGHGAFVMGDLAAFVVVGGAGDPGPVIDGSLGLVDGVDYITPPDEVNFDILELIQGIGVRSWEWTNVGVYVLGDTGPEGVMLLSVDDGPSDLAFASWPDTSGSPLSLGQNGLTMPAGEVAVFAESHSWLLDGPTYPGGTTNEAEAIWGWALGVGDPDGEDFAPLSVNVTYPPYRLWSPAGATTSHLKQVHRDDGYGITPTRARGASSRTATNRARAYD